MNKQPIKITRIELKDNKLKLKHMPERIEWQTNFLITGKTYADYKANSLILKSNKDLEKLFATTDMSENTPVIDIIRALFERNLRLGHIIKVFKFHKKTLINVFGENVAKDDDNHLVSKELATLIREYKVKRFEIIKIKEEFEEKLNEKSTNLKDIQSKIQELMINHPKTDLKIVSEGMVISKGHGYKTSGNSGKTTTTIARVEKVFGKKAVLENLDKLGLEIGAYVDFRTTAFDKKYRDKINEAKG